jgi:hypothetical protein
MSDSVDRFRVWRVGRKLGRTIYVQLYTLPSDDDYLIGVMDTPMLAKEAVDSHNLRLRNIVDRVVPT